MPSVAPAPALTVAPIGDGDVADVIALWQRCGLTRPWNDPASDIASRLDIFKAGEANFFEGRCGFERIAEGDSIRQFD